ncbi:MAG: ATP-binding cassette domain-containing protein, partial [Vicinamibacteria bacterium]
AVVARELTRRFGDFVAVDRVSFEVLEGEIFGFLGPNGAGKTTTIKMLAGLVRPSSGEGWVAGLDIMTETAAIQARIGYMSQLFSLYGDLTVEENLAFFARLYGVSGARRKERIAWALEMAGLEDRRDRLTAELPLGYKQRLALGSAVLHEPPILFLDEPTSGVDPLSRRSFWELIYDLASKGTTVFVTTHYMEEAEHCHRLALMNRGRLIALDSPKRLRDEMKSPLFEIRTPDGLRAVESLKGLPEVLDVALFGRALHVIVGDAGGAVELLRERLRADNVGVASINPIPPALEDVFVARVREAGGAIVD